VSEWKHQRILITGAHGFVGSHLVDRLKAQGYNDLLTPRHAEVDLREKKAVQDYWREKHPDLVIHLAASVGGIGANRKRPADFFYDNAQMGLNLLQASVEHPIGQLILLGTICAYPKFAPLPFGEESLFDGYPEETNAPYGIAKRGLLVAAEAYRQQYGLNYTALFPTNLYGPRDNFDLETSHVIPALIRKCEDARKQGEGKVRLWGTGKPSRDFLYVEDAVTGILLAMEKEGVGGEMFNLGSGQEVAISELAGQIARACDYQGEFEWDRSQPDGQPRRCVSAEKARNVLGFAPKFSLESGMEATVAWYREQKYE